MTADDPGDRDAVGVPYVIDLSGADADFVYPTPAPSRDATAPDDDRRRAAGAATAADALMPKTGGRTDARRPAIAPGCCGGRERPSRPEGFAARSAPAMPAHGRGRPGAAAPARSTTPEVPGPSWRSSPGRVWKNAGNGRF